MKKQTQLESIKKHLDKTLTYSEYKQLVSDLLKENKSTGFTQNETYLKYSKLGFSRMNRWEKTSELTAGQIETIQKVTKKQTWLVITEGWCGDAAPVIPIMNKIADINPLITFKLILRDENDELMSHFLTNGGKSIPKLVSFNAEENDLLFTWGPRPKEAADLVAKEKAEFGKLRDEFKITLQKWYNQDKGKNIAEDLVNCLKASD
jgi:pantothenate kinase-related protein Tda10